MDNYDIRLEINVNVLWDQVALETQEQIERRAFETRVQLAVDRMKAGIVKMIEDTARGL